VESFLLKDAERAVQSYKSDRIEKMRALFRAAELRKNAADELFENRVVAALALYREAALLYVAALLAVRSEAPLDDPLRPDQVFQRFRELESAHRPGSDRELDELVELIVANDPLVFDRLPQKEAMQRLGSVRDVVRDLRDLNEPRPLARIRAIRIVRIALLGVLFVGLFAWGALAVFNPTNIALSKPVTVSSVHPSSMGTPAGLTDGITSAAYGAHTNKEASPWVQVDLTEIYRIDRVKIYNRGDGWFDEGLPMTLAFSENGRDFVVVDTRTKSFGQWQPWVVDAKKARARYVRVNGAPGSFVALNEIEVFGKK
jgi:hypothetical protein